MGQKRSGWNGSGHNGTEEQAILQGITAHSMAHNGMSLYTRAPERWERWERVPSQLEILAATLD